MKWKAAMPREKPTPGTSHFVFAFKDHAGVRGELTGTMEDKELAPIIRQIMSTIQDSPEDTEAADS